ncbi:phage tail protein [Streptomyces sp. NPDC051704]|uniref:phage tail protein n=1 Tax=Streptomyces sp. NPDC051704 TaxID=3365671 RepID=UPI003795EE88
MTVQPISSGSFSLTFPNARKKDPIGVFTGLSGLSLWMEGDELYEGGVNDSPHYLTTHIRYKPLVLSRPVSESTPETCKWVIANMRDPEPRTGEVTLRTSGNAPMFTIEFLSLLPVAWRGPTLDTINPQVALEEIEFVHGGFTLKS